MSNNEQEGTVAGRHGRRGRRSGSETREVSSGQRRRVVMKIVIYYGRPLGGLEHGRDMS